MQVHLLEARQPAISQRKAVALPVASFVQPPAPGVNEPGWMSIVTEFASFPRRSNCCCASGLIGSTTNSDLSSTQSLAPRRVTLAGVVDAAGNSMESAAVRKIYADERLVIREKAGWDLDALSGWST